MKIVNIKSLLILILELDQIPVTEMVFEAPEYLLNILQFRSTQIKEEKGKPVILFENGKYQDNEIEIYVKKIEVDERKIIIEVSGNSSNADKIWEVLDDQFKRLADVDMYNNQPVIRSRESVIVANLDINAKNLIHPDLLKIMDNKVVKDASQNYADAVFSYFRIAARLDFLQKEERLKEYRVDITPKIFTIEPRDGTPLEKNMFLSVISLEMCAF